VAPHKSKTHYVSPFNFMGESSTRRRKVRFYDSTLRKALLLPGGRLQAAAHVRIAERLVEAGITGVFYNMFYDRKQLATDQKSQENHEAVRAVSRHCQSLRRIACLYAVPRNFDWKDACELSLEAGLNVLEPGIPVSDIERKADLPGQSRTAVADGLIRCIEFCRGLGATVSANLTDVGRCDPDYLIEVIRRAIAAGAREVRLSDSYSSLSPEGVHYLVRLVRRRIKNCVPLMVHIHDDYGLGSAATIAAALEGCDVDCTVGGIGDKGGFAALEEVGLALALLHGVPVALKLDRLPALAQTVADETGIPPAPTKAVIGPDIFVVENDAAVARMLRGEVRFDDPGARVVSRTYDPAIVGRQRKLVWGQTTLGGAATQAKLEQMQLPADASTVARINDEIRRRVLALPHYPCWLSEQDVEEICRRAVTQASPRRKSRPSV
jgi:isopropylmalate/homocitrate/citramalate synthase